jgi:RNA polymerase sigma-70 factor, ECF subfamily
MRQSNVHVPAGSTTSSFLDGLKQRDDAAWRRLATVYARLVLDWCRSAGVPSEERNDISQEVFRAVAASIDGFQFNPPDGTFRGWLRTITYNKIVDHFRRRNRHPVAIGGTDAHQRLMAIPDEISGSLPEATDREKAIVVRQTLELIRVEFEDRTWQAFWRTTVEDQQAGLVADSLGMTPGAVRQAKSRVLCRLREELRQLMEFEFFSQNEVRDSCGVCVKQ